MVCAAFAALSLVLFSAGCGASTPAHVVSQTPEASSAADLPGVQHPAAGNFRPNGVSIASCKPTSFACYEQAFGNLAYRSGPAAALALVSRLLDRNVPAVRGDCHTIAHLIGSATLARYHGNAAEAMGQGSMICGSGYYHGLIEYALEGARNEHQLIVKVKAMCSSTTALPTTFLRYQCVHGLGHGVMIFSGDNLPWALSMCGKLAGRWAQQSCSGGVFMQNFNLPSKLSPFRSQYIKKSDPLYPCDWVTVEYKLYCYLQITEHLLYATNYDWPRVAATCAKAPRPWSNFCFQSFGRDASGASRYVPAAANRLCRLTGRGLADCVYGVARDFTNNDVGGARAARFCGLVRQDVRGFCFYAIGTILDTFGLPKTSLDRTCLFLSKAYSNECEGIVTSAERALITEVPA